MPNGFLRDRLREHSCMECFFWNTAGYVVEEDNYDQMGDCERYPPREEEGENSYGYVATRSCQWCGEFKKNYKEDDFHYDILTEREREFEGKRVLVKLSNVANKRITELSRNMTMGRYRDEGGISSIRKALSDIEKREKDKYNSPATIG